MIADARFDVSPANKIKIAGENIPSATSSVQTKPPQTADENYAVNYSTVSVPETKPTAGVKSETTTSEAVNTIDFDGHIYSPNGIPLEGMLVYLKQNDAVVRLFKTDRQGGFKNNIPLAPETYFLEIEDPKKGWKGLYM